MTKVCDYGCDQPAPFYNERTKKYCCSKSYNSCPEIRRKNSESLKRCYKLGIKNNDHWNGKRDWAKGLTAYEDKRIRSSYSGDIFVYGGKGPHKKLLIKERGYKCECCNNTHWLDNPIPLELDHIDGDNKNNKKDNLRLLCINCHYFTPTYRGRKNNGLPKYSEDYLIDFIPKCKNITELLHKLDMSDSSNNHKRILKIMLKFNLTFINK